MTSNHPPNSEAWKGNKSVLLSTIPTRASISRVELRKMGVNKTEAGGRPVGGRRHDTEHRHNYLSEPFIDGGRWSERIWLEIFLHKSCESLGTFSGLRFVLPEYWISVHLFTLGNELQQRIQNTSMTHFLPTVDAGLFYP